MKEKNYCLVWSQQDSLIPRPVVTTDFVCLRLIGDRSIDEGDFGKIKKDRTKELQLWNNILKDIQNNEKNVKTTIVAANNHYAGFGPITSKLFAEMRNLQNKVRQFPVVDYQMPLSSNNTCIIESYRIYKKQHDTKKLYKLVFLNSSNNILTIQIFVIGKDI